MAQSDRAFTWPAVADQPETGKRAPLSALPGTDQDNHAPQPARHVRHRVSAVTIATKTLGASRWSYYNRYDCSRGGLTGYSGTGNSTIDSRPTR